VTHLIGNESDASGFFDSAKPTGAAIGKSAESGFPVRVPGRTGLITLIISPRHVLRQGRPMREAASDYIGELKACLDRERSRGARFVAEALAITDQAQ
jgi:hypothetical protein